MLTNFMYSTYEVPTVHHLGYFTLNVEATFNGSDA